MSSLKELQKGSIRSLPLSQQLRELLLAAATEAAIDELRVFSGGQPAYPGKPRTGSTRHDGGRAADLKLSVSGKYLRFSDTEADAQVLAFVESAAAHGAIGIGAGVEYMGREMLHVGFGTSVTDFQRLVWGKGGRSANAPHWLRSAAEEGWARRGAPAPLLLEPNAIATELGTPASYVVVARDGLRLRGGPGLEFEKLATIRAGTELVVLDFVGTAQEWAKVDLNADGLVDGFVYAAFLERAGDATE